MLSNDGGIKSEWSLPKRATIHFFLICSSALSLCEPILVGTPKLDGNNIQVIVLGLSTGIYIIGLFALSNMNQTTEGAAMSLRSTVLQAPVLFEGLCLLVGWIFIFDRPGLAALRCFRVFRLLWIFELYFKDVQKVTDKRPSYFFIGDVLGRNCRICLSYFKRLGEEVFSTESRGAIVVLIVFFYVTYILSVVFWIEKNTFTYYDPVANDNATENPRLLSQNSHCITLRSCYMNLLRLSYYDGNGFDLLAAVMYSHADGLVLLLMLYLIFTAIVLLNGLIGIFGYAFRDKLDQVSTEDRHEAYNIPPQLIGVKAIGSSERADRGLSGIELDPRLQEILEEFRSSIDRAQFLFERCLEIAAADRNGIGVAKSAGSKTGDRKNGSTNLQQNHAESSQVPQTVLETGSSSRGQERLSRANYLRGNGVPVISASNDAKNRNFNPQQNFDSTTRKVGRQGLDNTAQYNPDPENTRPPTAGDIIFGTGRGILQERIKNGVSRIVGKSSDRPASWQPFSATQIINEKSAAAVNLVYPTQPFVPDATASFLGGHGVRDSDDSPKRSRSVGNGRLGRLTLSRPSKQQIPEDRPSQQAPGQSNGVVHGKLVSTPGHLLGRWTSPRRSVVQPAKGPGDPAEGKVSQASANVGITYPGGGRDSDARQLESRAALGLKATSQSVLASGRTKPP